MIGFTTIFNILIFYLIVVKDVELNKSPYGRQLLIKINLYNNERKQLFCKIKSFHRKVALQ